MRTILRTICPPLVFLALLCCLLSDARAEDPYQVNWIQQLGTSSDDRSNSVAIDSLGNVYITGYTEGSLEGTNAGHRDAFLTKFDNGGSELWTQQIGSLGTDESNSVAVDGTGNVFITGFTTGDLGGTIIGATDAFLSKFDSNGSELWTEQIGAAGFDRSHSVAVDISGNAYITGHTKELVIENPLSTRDIFIAKFDGSGTELWTKQLLSDFTSDIGYDIDTDSDQNIYISGHGIPSGQLFFAKFDSNGNEIWSKELNTLFPNSNYSIAIDSQGFSYFTISINPSSTDSQYVLLTKLDDNGEIVWSQNVLDSTASETNLSLAIDDADFLYLSGLTYGSLEGSNAGESDAFLGKFDTDGNELWVEQIGTPGLDQSRSVEVDGLGNVYISGYTEGSLGGTNAGGEDAFIVKFSELTLQGDFNRDGTVDAADYTTWRDGAETIYDASDFDDWVANYGAISTGSASNTTSVPEPNGLILLAIVSIGLLRRR